MKIVCNIPNRLMASFHDDQMRVLYAATDTAVDIWLHGIVGDEYSSTDSLSVGQLLSQHRGKAVNLRVNSPGGLAYDGVAIYNAIKDHDGPTTGLIEGLAGSAASLAVIGCDTVKCYASAAFQPHYSLVMAYGHQAEIRQALDVQVKLDEQLEQVYADESGQSIDTVRSHLQGAHGDGTKFSAEEAMAAGYVDEIVKPGKDKPQNESQRQMMALRQARLALLGK